MDDTDNKVVVITGASSGIGRATAYEYARKGYNLVLAARRVDELHDVAEKCESYGVYALVVPTDTSDDAAVHQLADAAVDEYGHIDVWINGAAVFLLGEFKALPMEDIRRLMDVNFFGYIHGSHAALTQFREQGYGTLINISSVNAKAPQPYISIYSASKAAVRAFDESIRMELILEGLSDKIHVCTVMPASVDTNIFQNGANYTGKEIRALEPVYDPGYVAKHIAMLADFPKREITVGPAGKMMALQNALMPSMYERQIGKFTKADMLSTEPIDATNGNLYESIDTNSGMRGGWRHNRIRADYLNVTAISGLALAAVATVVGYLLLSKSKPTESE